MNQVQILAQILSNNLGQKLTVELANGIIQSFQQNMPKEEAKESTNEVESKEL